ncbi:hypothetical protein [Nocardioides massiliensis]|uniref:Arc/MetJ-type ribon-helix-helix transcriptional regulator n=1 Tax=Nocardioides massiliensis TaxID=1325935 RepID=A0ABT9NSJ2_9ACTN|nr:hypothetical protein [Nocardioides massiliensis]MDP9823390.1 Arc/MetJ-type ribon-helix-helix transcriptional regulator [Nocardioides massiliensis]
MTVKIAVSLPDAVVAQARAAVAEGRAASFSAYVAKALEQYGRTQALADLLDEWDRELGAPGADEVAWADEVLASTEA